MNHIISLEKTHTIALQCELSAIAKSYFVTIMCGLIRCIILARECVACVCYLHPHPSDEHGQNSERHKKLIHVMLETHLLFIAIDNGSLLSPLAKLEGEITASDKDNGHSAVNP